MSSTSDFFKYDAGTRVHFNSRVCLKKNDNMFISLVFHQKFPLKQVFFKIIKPVPLHDKP